METNVYETYKTETITNTIFKMTITENIVSLLGCVMLAMNVNGYILCTAQ